MKQIEHEEDERVRFAGIGCRLHKAEGRPAVRSAAAQLAIKVCLLCSAATDGRSGVGRLIRCVRGSAAWAL
jgi:hypothetical protein